jgi:hypothetical protein
MIWKGVMLLLLGALILAPVMGGGCGGKDEAIRWRSPDDGEEVWGIVDLKVKADADHDVAEVKFYCDAVDEEHLIGIVSDAADLVYARTWYSADVENGEHVLYAVADGEDGESSEVSITVEVANITRAEAIPVGAVKRTPQTDAHPPVLSSAFSAYWHDPVPLGVPMNTAGYEDSPFITPDGNNFYFFFTPDMYIPPEQQVLDRVSGIYWSQKVGEVWTEPERVWLNDNPSLEGAEMVLGNTMWFCSARVGTYREIDMYTAELVGGRWTNWTNAGELLNKTYEVGELHVSADGNEIYFHSERAGGMGDNDLWVTRKVNGEWQTPENVAEVNTANGEGWPYLSEDGGELWFTRSVNDVPEGMYRSVKVGGQWQTPEKVLSSLAGEPTLDRAGNLYFVHHYWDDAAQRMWEADIYVCYRK